MWRLPLAISRIVSRNRILCDTVIQLLTLSVLRVKAVSHYKYLGIVLDIELSDDDDIQRQLQYQYYAAMRASFFRCSNAVKNLLFRSFCRSMMHHHYGLISGRHTSTDCVWPITLVAGFYTACRGDRVLVVIRFSVTFLPLRPYWKKCL